MKKMFKGLLLVATSAAFGYGFFLVEKWKTNKMIETPTPEVVVINEEDWPNCDWEDFTRALIWVESNGNCKAVGSNNDIGVLQITPILLKDCNRIIGYERFSLEDRLDSLKSVEMFNIIQDHYNPQHDFHLALKIWNPKAKLSYHYKVMDMFYEIKND